MNGSDKKDSKVRKRKTAQSPEGKSENIVKLQAEAKKKEPIAKKQNSRNKIEAKPAAESKSQKAQTQVKSKDQVETKAEPKIIKTKSAAKTKELLKSTAEPKPGKTKSPVESEKSAPLKARKKPAEKALLEAESKRKDSLPLAAKIQTQENFDLSEKVEETALSPVFRELAEPKLPALPEENRAFLQIQSPTRLFFYWSLKQNSQETLRRALGNRAGDYSLAVKLTNLTTKKEEIHRVDSKGSWWFNNIEADSKYRAEAGFYAQGQPFVRIVFSNILETPRQKPSANTDYQPYFAVTADQFAEVLDLAGFSQDAFEVYLAGDEPQSADDSTRKAFLQLAGKGQVDFADINLHELRYVLFALASGVSLFALREQVSGDLFEFLAALINENPDALTEEKVILALEDFFGVSPLTEEFEEGFGAPTVFGASLLNFPKQLRRKESGYNPQEKISPLSSFGLQRRG